MSEGAYLVNPQGQTVRIPMAEVPELLDSGWGAATPEQAAPLQKERQLQAEHGDTASQVQTFGESLGDTLTAGLFGHGLNALGADPEARKAREEANPWAHGLGIAAGVLAPVGAPGLIGKAGAATAEGLGALLPEATSLLGKVGVGAAKGLASGAVEGGLFAGGNVIHEQALGDPNLTAQAAATEMGLGALLGGGLSGGLGALGALTKGLVSGSLGKKLADWLPDFEGERNIKAAGAIQGDIAKAEGRLGADNLRALGREAGEKGLVEAFDTPSAVLEKSAAFKASAGQRMGTVLDEATAAGAAAPSIRPILNRLDLEVLAKLEANPLEKGTTSAVRQMLADYGEKFAPELGRNPTLKDLHSLRMEIDDKLFGLRGIQDPGATPLKAALRKFRGIVSEELDTALEGVGKEVSGAWKEANRDYQLGATMERFAEKGVQRAVGNNLGSLTEVMGGLTGFVSHGLPGGALLGLGTAAVRRHSASLLGAGARGLRQYLEAGAPGAVPETVAALSQLKAANQAVADKVDSLLAKAIAAPAGLRLVSSAGAGQAASRALADTRIVDLQRVASSPQAVQETLVAHGGDLQEHAPDTAQALQIHRARQLSYLALQIPQLPTLGPLGPKLKLTDEQAWRFNRAYDAVDNPTSILGRMKVGTMIPTDVEAVRQTAPQLYERMVAMAMEKVAAHKGTLPYQTKLQLSMLVGGDLDGTLGRPALAANQAVYMRPSAKGPDNQTGPAATGRPNQAGASKIKVASRAQTPGEAAQSRMDAP